MNRIRRTLKQKGMIFILCILAISVTALPRISFNGSGIGYEEGSGDEQAAVSNLTIETYIIDGAVKYLKGHSYIQNLLSIVELQDAGTIDYPELQRLTDDALEHIAGARIIYERLVERAEVTPYNLEIINRLKSFDYKAFAGENIFNEAVFNKVASYLLKGDITSTFKYTLTNIKAIEELLTEIKAGADIDGLTGLDNFWKLNELCAEISLFGSYSARIFHRINQK